MFKFKFKGLVPCAIAACSAIYSCTNNDEPITNNGQESQFGEFVNPSKQIVDENLSEFAGILSKVIASNKDVRVFLKNESLKEFDKNTDVLYYLVCDEQIGDKTFRELLVEASSEDVISKIEKNVPLLNIYNVRVDPLEVYPENLDVEDNDIPVAVSLPDSTYLYFNGIKEYGLAKGEVPGFNLFVVGLNSRVDAKSIAMANNNRIRNKGSLKRAASKTIMFKSPNYDGRESNRSIRKTALTTENYVGSITIQAYNIFNKSDNSLYQKAFQRDYIYYGITPSKQKGPLNNNVSEYLAYIQVNPNTYFIIGEGDKEKEDPHLKDETSYTQKRSTLTTQEQIDKFWTRGVYNFKFEIIKSTQKEADVVNIPLRPEEIWNFNIKYEKKEATWLKHSKHTYTIDPRNFTAKNVYLNNLVDLGKWDISTEALSRTVIISEVDGEEDVTTETTYQVQKAKEQNFKGDVKMNIGLKTNKANVTVEPDISYSANSSTTTTKTIKVTTHYKKGSDDLGKATIYFYDPIILSKLNITLLNRNNYLYDLKTYNTGCVTFSIIAKAK